MQFHKRRLTLAISVVLALAAAFAGFDVYQNYAREKQNQEMLAKHKQRQEQQRKIFEAMRVQRERTLIKRPKPLIQTPKSPETPSN